MPHQCTNCGHTFPDGSKEMLSGCPDCGGNKFQFKPAGRQSEQSTSAQDSSSRSTSSQNNSNQPTPSQNSSNQSTSPQQSADQQTDQSTAEPAVSNLSASDRQAPESPQSAPETAQSPPETKGVADDSGFVSKELQNTDESPAQSSARSDVVSSDELTAAGSAGSGSTDDSTKDAVQPTDSASDTPDESAAGSSTQQSVDDTETDQSSLDQLRKELNDQFESIRIVSPGQYELNLMELYDREEYIISLREDGRYVIEVPDGWGDS